MKVGKKCVSPDAGGVPGRLGGNSPWHHRRPRPPRTPPTRPPTLRQHCDSDKRNVHNFLKAGHERNHTASGVVICSPAAAAARRRPSRLPAACSLILLLTGGLNT